MNKRARMPRVDDHATKRRVYLLRTINNHVVAATSLFAAGFFAIVSIILMGCLVASILMLFQEDHHTGSLGYSLICGIALCVTGWLTNYFVAAAVSISPPLYVPPVREQLAALPADAILLRGSDQPTAAPNELLRAANGTESRVGELLRPTRSRPL